MLQVSDSLNVWVLGDSFIRRAAQAALHWPDLDSLNLGLVAKKLLTAPVLHPMHCYSTVVLMTYQTTRNTKFYKHLRRSVRTCLLSYSTPSLYVLTFYHALSGNDPLAKWARRGPAT